MLTLPPSVPQSLNRADKDRSSLRRLEPLTLRYLSRRLQGAWLFKTTCTRPTIRTTTINTPGTRLEHRCLRGHKANKAINSIPVGYSGAHR